jgi:hypothetical protein
MRSAMLEVRYKIFGKEKKQRLAVMRSTDAESVSSSVVFHDPRSKVEYRVNWYPANGQAIKGEWQSLEDTYLVLAPPG